MIDHISQWLPGFLLVLARLSGLIVTMPIFSYRLISGRIKVMVILSTAVLIYPLVQAPTVAMESIAQMIFQVGGELLTGMLIGMGARVIFEALNMAGSFVGRQMGLAIANVMDPTSRQQLPVISQFWFLLMIVFFLSVNGHYLLIDTIFKNFQLIPLGSAIFSPEAGEVVVRSGSTAFQISLSLAAPAMVFLLLVDTAIALVARVMPQMNIFIITLPLKIATGIFILIISVDIFQLLYDTVYRHIGYYFQNIITSMQST